jgi:heat-inducible transcriptional repressor
MVVVITSTGGVTKRMIAFDAPVDPRLAEWGAAFLNERLGGRPVGARRTAAWLEEPSLSARERAFLDAVAPAVTELEEETALFVGGQARVLGGGRMQDLREIEALLRSLEQRYVLLNLLRDALERSEIYLRIGSELPEPSLRGLSLVAASYGVARRNLGTVSLLGPTRMDYRLAMATVREASHALSDFVEGVYG